MSNQKAASRPFSNVTPTFWSYLLSEFSLVPSLSRAPSCVALVTGPWRNQQRKGSGWYSWPRSSVRNSRTYVNKMKKTQNPSLPYNSMSPET